MARVYPTSVSELMRFSAENARLPIMSRDGRRIYFTSSLYAAWDDQFYPEGVGGWMAKVDADLGGGMRVDPDFFVDFGQRRAHQVHLEGGDASSDSFCFP